MKKDKTKLFANYTFFSCPKTQNHFFVYFVLTPKNQTHAQHTPQTNKEKVGDENMMKDIYLGFFSHVY